MECIEYVRGGGGVCRGHPVRTRCYANTGTPTEVRHRYTATKQHQGTARNHWGGGGSTANVHTPTGCAWSKH